MKPQLRRWVDNGLIELTALSVAGTVFVAAMAEHWWAWLAVPACAGIYAWRIRQILSRGTDTYNRPDGSDQPN